MSKVPRQRESFSRRHHVRGIAPLIQVGNNLVPAKTLDEANQDYQRRMLAAAAAVEPLDEATTFALKHPQRRLKFSGADPCQRRKARREVLHAMGKTGPGSGKGPRRPKSRIKC